MENKRILFLGYDRSRTRLIDLLIKRNCIVDQTDRLIDGQGSYDLVVSFGYQHILKPKVIKALGCDIFNLHISFLPFNRGAHPNFWSFYDNTPAGVTIHLIDEGLDTGPIAAQRQMEFDTAKLTFADTYKQLMINIESLFEENVGALLDRTWNSTPQFGNGSFHYLEDLPVGFSGWNANIEHEIERLKTINESKND